MIKCARYLDNCLYVEYNQNESGNSPDGDSPAGRAHTVETVVKKKMK